MSGRDEHPAADVPATPGSAVDEPTRPATGTARTWAVPPQPDDLDAVYDDGGLRWDHDAGTDLWHWEHAKAVEAGWTWQDLVGTFGPLSDRAPAKEAGGG